MGNYEFFKKEFEFHGKHARMAGELWVKGDYEHTYFRRLIDLYMVAAVVGFRVDRKAKEDFSPFGTKSILAEQVINAKEELDFIMMMGNILDNAIKFSEAGKISCFSTFDKYKILLERLESLVASLLLPRARI